MSDSCAVLVKASCCMIFFGLKFLYLIGLLVYLIYYAVSGDTGGYVFQGLVEVIQQMGALKLIIAVLFGLALECTGFYGLWHRKTSFLYLLVDLSIVPLYLYYSHFHYLWVLYVVSLVTYIIMIHWIIFDDDDQDESNRDVEANRVQVQPPVAPQTVPQARDAQNQTRVQRLETIPEVVDSRIEEKYLPKPKDPPARDSQNQTRVVQSEAKPWFVAASPEVLDTRIHEKYLPKTTDPQFREAEKRGLSLLNGKDLSSEESLNQSESNRYRTTQARNTNLPEPNYGESIDSWRARNFPKETHGHGSQPKAEVGTTTNSEAQSPFLPKPTSALPKPSCSVLPKPTSFLEKPSSSLSKPISALKSISTLPTTPPPYEEPKSTLAAKSPPTYEEPTNVSEEQEDYIEEEDDKEESDDEESDECEDEE